MTRGNADPRVRRPSRRRRRPQPWDEERRWRYDAEVLRVLSDLRQHRDPVGRAWQAGRLIGLRSELATVRRDALAELHRRGMSWRDVGRLMGWSKAHAHRLGTGADGRSADGEHHLTPTGTTTPPDAA